MNRSPLDELREVFTSTTVNVWISEKIRRKDLILGPGRTVLMHHLDHAAEAIVLGLKVKMDAGTLNEVRSEDRCITYDMVPRTPWEAIKWMATTILDTYPVLGRRIKWRHVLASSQIRYKETRILTQHLCPHSALSPNHEGHRQWIARKLPVIGSEWEWTETRKLIAELDAAFGIGMEKMTNWGPMPPELINLMRAYWRFNRERQMRIAEAAHSTVPRMMVKEGDAL